MSAADLPQSVLSRVEDAGLNASAPPQQRWVDGWLVRYSPGKAKRARCINAVADGRLSIDERLAECLAIYRAAGLPAVVRITPFTRPGDLDGWLERLGWPAFDDTRVMVAQRLPATEDAFDSQLELQPTASADFAAQVGLLRASPADQCRAHAERLAGSPVPYQGWLLRRRDDGEVLACGQFALESDMVGLYDVFTRADQRGRGLARELCTALLNRARRAGARIAYLQVDAGNAAARAVYRRLGFADAYSYHYRTPDPALA